MIATLDELAQYIRRTIPNPNALVNLQAKERLGAVIFYWHGTEFLVKPTLNVLEMRGNNLYLTGLSMLLQTVLVRTNQHERSFANALSALGEAQELIQERDEPEQGVKLLKSVGNALERLVTRN